MAPPLVHLETTREEHSHEMPDIPIFICEGEGKMEETVAEVEESLLTQQPGSRSVSSDGIIGSGLWSQWKCW